jgi:predicted HicB family RNase H-like nuclease
MTTRKDITTEEFDRRFDAGEDISDLVDWTQGKRLHGGKRAGSGRKRAGRKAYTVRLRPEIHEAIQQRAQKKGVTISEYIEELASY